MTVEHIGFTVSSPKEMAKWYEENLGFVIQFEGGNEKDGMVFISDESRSTILELLKSSETLPINELINHSDQLHIALKSEDPYADKERLVAAGASYVGEKIISNCKDILIMLKDPWGNYLQIAKREDKNKFNK
ncbi:MAG: VOC family protein [Bacillota bacterium]|nr:VOC family protein [Bacillota bacterium]